MKLQKYMAHCGVASRRKSEEMIKEGKVVVNGEVIDFMGKVIDPDRDVVKVNGRRIKPESIKKYILLYKPEGYVCTLSDEKDRKTVIDLVKDVKERVYPVGRLDYNTSGLLIMTNDGDLAYKLTHPKHEIKKTYMAKVRGHVGEDKLEKLRNGVQIEGYKTSPAIVRRVKENQGTSVIEISIHEGKNRQVRKMFDNIGHSVVKLQRVSIGRINLENLEKGKWRLLTNKEVNYLREGR
ncbi:MAG: rRNA pseudouridine synthase [Anaeromicrobium sp.]|uniref:pseudouridine synthase n=1 Tax=Anaeromicrobium sp. TaxID=1929132 RepID=UPI0025FFFED6|nr:pseudouridine synthase [Anaeromicrobium sp.]MCT4594697.1 rRNA pseudouridine synthase [Anaeromicrobium sp.]